MTHHETQARRILDQAAKDNAEHPIGIDKHRVFRIAEALAEGEAQRNRLFGIIREFARGFRSGQREKVQTVYEAAKGLLADIDKEIA